MGDLVWSTLRWVGWVGKGREVGSKKEMGRVEYGMISLGGWG